jgi:hypothetical protein
MRVSRQILNGSLRVDSANLLSYELITTFRAHDLSSPNQLLAYYQRIGGIFKVCLGPKAFLIVSDAAVVRHLLSEKSCPLPSENGTP